MKRWADGRRYHGVRAVVLGASGFIGRWVARALCAYGAELVLFVRIGTETSSRKLLANYNAHGEILPIELRDFDGVQTLLRKVRPAIVFNLAGYGVARSERDETTAYQINRDLLTPLCLAMQDIRDASWRGQQIVHVGTALEYGVLDNDLHESSPPNPTTLYGKSKLAGTEKLAEYSQRLDLKAVTARLFTVYGPGELPNRLLPALMKTAVTEEPLPLTDGHQKRDFVYVMDAAEGLLRLGLTSTRPGEIVNLATGKLTSVRTFIEISAEVLGIPVRNLLFGALPTRVEEMEHRDVSIKRLQRLIGWTPPTGLAAGIDKTKSFYQKLNGGVER